MRVNPRDISRSKVWAGWLLVLGLFLVPGAVRAQGWTYSENQSVTPAFEGWERNDDGSYNLLFGYLNRNWEEEPGVPVGPNNFFSPGPEDRGQPTHFLPRRNRYVFEVRVPADFGEDDALVWTVTANGETKKAYGTILPDYYTDKIVIMSEVGALGNGRGTEATRANTAPVVELAGEAERTTTVGEPMTLVMKVTDDGPPAVPRMEQRAEGFKEFLTEGGELDMAKVVESPPRQTVPGKVNALHVSWFVYRGEGTVTFNPRQIKVWEDTRPFTNSPWSWGWIPPEQPEDGRWETEVTFHEPGTYILRGRADDGGLYADRDVTVHVMPPAAP